MNIKNLSKAVAIRQEMNAYKDYLRSVESSGLDTITVAYSRTVFNFSGIFGSKDKVEVTKLIKDILIGYIEEFENELYSIGVYVTEEEEK